ncbi:hypothetical protein ABXJ76_08295 [Methylobacter sp. G7]|uniref:hypothetical protein n=1 Tax=Methylobacter sp. G7 TaxID=3230117 RepID=UPI003D80A060
MQKTILGLIATLIITGCSTTPFPPTNYAKNNPDITLGTTDLGPILESVKIRKNFAPESVDDLQSCMVQEVSSTGVLPIINKKRKSIVMQGKGTFTLIISSITVPFEIRYSLTSSIDDKSLIFNFTNIKSINGLSLNAAEEASRHIEGAYKLFQTVTDKIENCSKAS